jgi:hypothetical protein
MFNNGTETGFAHGCFLDGKTGVEARNYEYTMQPVSGGEPHVSHNLGVDTVVRRAGCASQSRAMVSLGSDDGRAMDELRPRGTARTE